MGDLQWINTLSEIMEALVNSPLTWIVLGTVTLERIAIQVVRDYRLKRREPRELERRFGALQRLEESRRWRT